MATLSNPVTFVDRREGGVRLRLGLRLADDTVNGGYLVIRHPTTEEAAARAHHDQPWPIGMFAGTQDGSLYYTSPQATALLLSGMPCINDVSGTPSKRSRLRGPPRAFDSLLFMVTDSDDCIFAEVEWTSIPDVALRWHRRLPLPGLWAGMNGFFTYGAFGSSQANTVAATADAGCCVGIWAVTYSPTGVVEGLLPTRVVRLDTPRVDAAFLSLYPAGRCLPYRIVALADDAFAFACGSHVVIVNDLDGAPVYSAFDCPSGEPVFGLERDWRLERGCPTRRVLRALTLRGMATITFTLPTNCHPRDSPGSRPWLGRGLGCSLLSSTVSWLVATCYDDFVSLLTDSASRLRPRCRSLLHRVGMSRCVWCDGQPLSWFDGSAHFVHVACERCGRSVDCAVQLRSVVD